jgi:hypothetical protein
MGHEIRIGNHRGHRSRGIPGFRRAVGVCWPADHGSKNDGIPIHTGLASPAPSIYGTLPTRNVIEPIYGCLQSPPNCHKKQVGVMLLPLLSVYAGMLHGSAGVVHPAAE